MGALRGWEIRRNPVLKWVWPALGLALLPGILSSNLEFFRIFLVFPLVLALAGLGFQQLASSLTPVRRVGFLALTLAGIASLNLYHLFGPYQDRWKRPEASWGFYKSPENFRAY